MSLSLSSSSNDEIYYQARKKQKLATDDLEIDNKMSSDDDNSTSSTMNSIPPLLSPTWFDNSNAKMGRMLVGYNDSNTKMYKMFYDHSNGILDILLDDLNAKIDKKLIDDEAKIAVLEAEIIDLRAELESDRSRTNMQSFDVRLFETIDRLIT